MRYAVIVPLLLGLLGGPPARAQSLPTISANMVLLTAIVSANSTATVQQKGPLALTSLTLANFGSKAASVLVGKAVYSGSGCTGTVTAMGRYFYVLVPPTQTLQLTYPSALAFFPDQSGTVCLMVQNAGNGELDASLVGYTQ